MAYMESQQAEERRLAVGTRDGDVFFWDLESSACLGILEGHSKKILSLHYSPLQPHEVVTASSDHTIRVWDIQRRKVNIKIEGFAGLLAPTVRWASRIAGEAQQGGEIGVGTVRVWDTETGAVVHTLQGHTAQVVCLSFEKGRLASGDLEGGLVLWGMKTGELLHKFEGHEEAVRSVLLIGSQYLISGSEDKSIRAWSVKYGHCLFVKRRHAAPVTTLSHYSGSFFLSGAEDGAVYLWCAEAEALQRVLTEHTGAVRRIENTRGVILTASVDNAALAAVW